MNSKEYIVELTTVVQDSISASTFPISIAEKIQRCLSSELSVELVQEKLALMQLSFALTTKYINEQMHDDSEETTKIIQFHEALTSYCSQLCAVPHDIPLSCHIINVLLELSKLDGDAAYSLWIWGTAVKMISKQNKSFGSTEFSILVEQVGKSLARETKKSLKFAPEMSCSQMETFNKNSSKLLQIYLVFMRILLKFKSLITPGGVESFLAFISDCFEVIEPSILEKFIHFASNIQDCPRTLLADVFLRDLSLKFPGQINATTKSTNYELDFCLGSQDGLLGINCPPLIGHLVLLERIPQLIFQMKKTDQKRAISSLVQMGLSSQRSTIRHLVEAAILKTLILLPPAVIIELFTMRLVEQIYVATVLPFKPGLESAIKPLYSSILSIWRRTLEGKDIHTPEYLPLIIEAISNIIQEGVVNELQLVLDLIKQSITLDWAVPTVLKMIRVILPACSFKQVGEVVELFQKIGQNSETFYQTWKLFSKFATLKSPEIIHKRFLSTSIPHLEKAFTDAWTLKFIMLSSCEVYARYSSSLEVFEHPFLARFQENLLKFYEFISPEADYRQSLVGYIGSGRYSEYRSIIKDDPIVASLKHVNSRILEVPLQERHKYVELIEFMLSQSRAKMFRHELENYVVEHEIGHGSFATVYKGYDKETGSVVAIKAINSERLNRKLSENLATEISIMKEFKSEHIVELYDLQKSGNYIYLVMEYCEAGDLAGLLRRKKVLEEYQVSVLIRQLGAALQVLHKANYAHRDLKPQNLLLKELEGQLFLKLGDFGFARFVDPADLAETLCGSPLYMAPEILKYEKYDGKADLWSIGAIMYEMLFGRPPFRAQNHIQLLRVIEATEKVEIPKDMSITESCRDLILGLLKKDPEERFTFEQFITHPFLDMKAPLPLMEAPPKEVGFTIPKFLRPRSASVQQMPSEKKSSLSTSFKQQLAATAAKSPSVQQSQSIISALSNKSNKEELPFQEERNFSRLLEGVKYLRPALVKIIQRDARLAIILQQIAESNSSLLQISSSDMQAQLSVAVENSNLLLTAIELCANILTLLKDSKVTHSEEGARAIVIWLTNQIEEIEQKLKVPLNILEKYPSCSMIRTSASFLSPTVNRLSEVMYEHAMKSARDGCLQELLGYGSLSQLYYQRSLFLLELLQSSIKPAAIVDPNPGPHDLRIIQGYIKAIQNRGIMNFLRRFIVSQRPGFSSLSRTRLRNVPTFRSYSSAEKGSDAGETKVNDNPSEALDANKSLAEKEAKITELSDSYLRLLADMENLRTRTKREIESAGQFAITKFSKDIIGVADVLEMALKSVDPEHPLLTGNAAEKAEADSDAEAVPELKNNVNADPKLAQLVQGIEMTLEEVRKVLMKHGILPILPLHQKFDPNLHNALFQVPTGDVEPGTVVNVIKRGYLLHHRVLRAADVGVSKAP